MLHNGKYKTMVKTKQRKIIWLGLGRWEFNFHKLSGERYLGIYRDTYRLTLGPVRIIWEK